MPINHPPNRLAAPETNALPTCTDVWRGFLSKTNLAIQARFETRRHRKRDPITRAFTFGNQSQSTHIYMALYFTQSQTRPGLLATVVF
jgi:hypothetical protein